MGTKTLAVWAVVYCHATAASAQGPVLTLSGVLARAREHAPEIISARLAVEEARGRLSGASIRRQSNPQIDAALGNRTSIGRYTDFEVGLGQSFEPGGRRSARIAGANAAVASSASTVDEVTRSVLRSAASAFYRAVHANERIRLLNAAYELASSVYSTAERRYKAGDIAVLDVNIAKASRARVGAEREEAEASKTLVLGELRQILGIEVDVGVDGTLPRPSDADLAAALDASRQRPELRVLEAGVQEADAEVQLGYSFSRPEYGLGVRYSHEEGDRVLLGGLTITLPMFSAGQGQRAVGSARAARLRAELAAAKTRVHTEVRAAFDAYARRVAALRVLDADAVPGLDENEQLTTRSFEVGQLGLPDLLLIRREILDTRFQYLDALLEAALARVNLDASAALLR